MELQNNAEKKKHIQNTTPRRYETINGFEIRTGKFVDPNSYLNEEKWEIRITGPDFELMQVLEEKLMEILRT